MKKHHVKEFLPLLQAWSDGEILQIRRGFDWVDLEDPNPMLTLAPSDYRIKPQVYWLVTFTDPKVPFNSMISWVAKDTSAKDRFINEIKNRKSAKILSIIEVNGDAATILPNP